MRKSHSIPPFPAEIDRTHFASWLSGFTDGKGCFLLRYDAKRNVPVIIFSLSLRSDDAGALQLIQSFWQCGLIYIDAKNYARFPAAPKANFRVNRNSDHVSILLPHFETFPLLAKKKRDLVVWHEAVILQQSVMRRQRRSARSAQGKFGRVAQWSPEEIARFITLSEMLKRQRRYQAPEVPSQPPPNGDMGTWDSLFPE